MTPFERAGPAKRVLRGMARHCPRCGGGHVFDGWFRLLERCPTCGMRFAREEGFWLGGYVINIAAGEAALLVLLALLIDQLSSGHHIQIWPYAVAGALIAVGGPLATFPYSRTVWCAIYLVMKPLAPDEVTEAQDFIARSALAPPPAGEEHR